jgi:hypothetical protein
MLAIAGSTCVYAQQRPAQPNPQRIAATTNAHIAALKAGLELTPDQVQKWPAYQQALLDLLQIRVQRLQARQTQQAGNQQSQTPRDPFNRLGRLADNMTKTSAALKNVANAGEPLYQSLTDAQKSRYRMLTRALLPRLLMIRQRQQQRQQRQQRG